MDTASRQALAGIVAGGLYGMIPAYFMCRFGHQRDAADADAQLRGPLHHSGAAAGPWRDPSQLGFFKVARFSSQARVPEVLGVHAGWIVALVLVALFYVYLRHSKQGYELTVVGENEATARYAGMPVKRVIIRTMFLSAGVCGLAGMLQASGADRTLNDNRCRGGWASRHHRGVAGAAQPHRHAHRLGAVLHSRKGLRLGAVGLQPLGGDGGGAARASSSSSCWAANFSSPSHLSGEQAGRRRGTWLTACGSTSSSRRSRRAWPLLLGTLGENPHRKGGQPQPRRRGA